MSGVSLGAKSYRELKLLGKKHGLTNVDIKKADLLGQIRKAMDSKKESREVDPRGAQKSTSGINYRRMVQKLDPELYKILNPILYLLPEMRPLVREGEPRSPKERKVSPFSSFLLEWNPWREAYLELDGVMSTIDVYPSYASRILLPIQEHEDWSAADFQKIIHEEDFMTFWKLFPVLTYVYALQYHNFLLLAVYYDLQDIFNISSAADARIKLAMGLSAEERRALLWEVESPEVFAYLTHGDATNLQAPGWAPWADPGSRESDYKARQRTVNYVAQYVSYSSARLVAHVLRSKSIVRDLKAEIRSQRHHPIQSAIHWENGGTEEKVLALLKYGLLKPEEIIVLAVESQANMLVAEILGSSPMLRHLIHKTRGSLLAISLVAENVGATRILVAAGVETSIEFLAEAESGEELFTPLLWAARIGNPLLLNIFLDLGLDSAKLQGRDTISALSQAVLLEDAFMVNIMLEHGPTLSTVDTEGKTALDYALEIGADDIIAILEDA